MRLTYTIVGRTLLGAEVGSHSANIEPAMEVVFLHTFDRLKRLLDWPAFLPTPRNLRFRKALEAIDAVVYRMIEEHRLAASGDCFRADLLSLLLRVRDEESGAGLSDEQLRNEAITFLVAGHETTANALTWTWYLLSRHPEVERQLQDELRAVLGGEMPTFDDLPRLVYTKAVVKEAIRLYPPIWIIERRVIADDVVGSYRLPAGSSVVISPYLLHRHAQFWDRPDEFDPERFKDRAPAAYIPFGAGPRFCIGSEFSMMEAHMVLAMVAQRFRLRLAPGHLVEPLPGITLRARNGLWMTLHQ